MDSVGIISLLVVSVFLVGAVIFDCVNHRIPNYYVLLGLLLAITLQTWTAGWTGILAGGAGLLTGFALFLPFYALGGMAAGDVKLMAVVGSFLGWSGALWAGVLSLIAGSLLGIVYLLCKGQLGKLLGRYWAMASLRTHIPAQDNDAARDRFPYALAIAVGTLASLYWTPF